MQQANTNQAVLKQAGHSPKSWWGIFRVRNARGVKQPNKGEVARSADGEHKAFSAPLPSPRSVGMRGIRGASLYPASSAVRRTGMTSEASISAKRGFTLIELLVVVLIIGILAAVALPQYQKIVWKIRAAQIIPVVRSLAEAEKIYFIEHGTYTEDLSRLDLKFSQPTTYDERQISWTLHAQEVFSYKHVYAEINRYGNPHFYIRYDLENGWLECMPQYINLGGHTICKSLSKTEAYPCANRTGMSCYRI